MTVKKLENIIAAICIVLTVSNFAIASDNGLPIVIITVDVESKKIDGVELPMPEQVNAICMNNISCGLGKMTELLKEKGYPAVFFLNVYEYKKYGEEPVMEIAKWFDGAGHDVQLHIHPQWAYDKDRNLTHQYTLDEQIKIIRDGKDLLEKWLDKPVLAHRAGAYGADENTLKALIENDILYDSSLFIASENSKVTALDLKKNVLSMYGPLYEFPVTVYRKHEEPPFLKGLLKPVSRVRKYDANWFADEAETEKAVREAIDMKLDFIILFLHSFSFIKHYTPDGDKIADIGAIHRFEHLLNIIKREELRVITFQDIKPGNLELSRYLNRQDSIPDISAQINAVQYSRKRMGITAANYKVFLTVFSLIAIFGLIATIKFIKRKNKNA
ncbi:MAG: hypothetical protein C4526_06185 [Nitrospiraceae bacterium]|nr:MAG: hypothetical protein C4526_06185 [Nitrospiraceae bacterium]